MEAHLGAPPRHVDAHDMPLASSLAALGLALPHSSHPNRGPGHRRRQTKHLARQILPGGVPLVIITKGEDALKQIVLAYQVELFPDVGGAPLDVAEGRGVAGP